MPGVSFYLEQKALDSVRAKSKARQKPVSQIIREAVEQYLSYDEKKAAKERVLRTLEFLGVPGTEFGDTISNY